MADGSRRGCGAVQGRPGNPGLVGPVPGNGYMDGAVSSGARAAAEALAAL